LSSTLGASQNVHKLRDFLPLIRLVARRDGILNAVADMITQDFLFHPIESGANRADLRDDIDAVAIFIDHFRKAAHLSLDAVEAFSATGLDVVSHVAYIPPQGIICKDRKCRNPMNLHTATPT